MFDKNGKPHKQYPVNYHRDTANIELWFEKRRMKQTEVNSIIARFGKRHKPKVNITRKEIETNRDVFLIDYTSVSCVTLDTHKNRYLLDKNGDYFVYGFLCAKCVLTNHKFAMLVEGSQIKDKDLIMFKKLIEKQLGYKILMVTDNRHNHSLLADKKDTMLIEVEFGGLKTKLYRMLKPLQYYQNNKIITLITFKNLLKLYLHRLQKCQITIIHNNLLDNFLTTNNKHNKQA